MTATTETVLTALIGSGTLSGVITWALNRRTNERLETLKANLVQGHSITKAQYDLELEAFRDVWSALHRVGTAARSIGGPIQLKILTPEGEYEGWRRGALAEATSDFRDAHNNAVRAINQHAPFYPVEIRQKALATFSTDIHLLNCLGTIDETHMTPTWFQPILEHTALLNSQVDLVEKLIRARLEMLRVRP